MSRDLRPLGVGDLVKVLRSTRLPREDVLGIGPIERVSVSARGTRLYWVRGFACARTERTLRRTNTLAETWAAEDEEVQS